MEKSGIGILILAGLVVARVLVGCSDPNRNLYQGIQMRNEMGKTPQERENSPRQPSYDQYKKERDQQDQP